MNKIIDLSYKKIELPLGNRSHQIHIGYGAVEQLGKWLPERKQKRAYIIADEKLKQARGKLIKSLNGANWETVEIPVRAGEELKDFAAIYPIYGQLLKTGANRDSIIFALGGGTIGDSAGFIAATYLRGVEWVGVPTTLLAQVDSSVGGKTGINHPEGKNLIGCFYQPRLVICDTQFLNTLERREIISGFAEMIKYGLIFDPEFYEFLKKNFEQILDLDFALMSEAIHRCLDWKTKTVAEDELDRTGVRQNLNFGHTFGHALESLTQYTVFQHGEAVLLGLRFALTLSEIRGRLAREKRLEIESFLSKIPVPPLPNGLTIVDLMETMKKDKKVKNGKIHFVLLKGLGQPVEDSDVSVSDVQQAYELFREGINNE